LQLQTLEVRDYKDVETAFTAMASERAEALYVMESPVLHAQQPRLIGLAIQSRLPTMFGVRGFVDAGGLMAYGADPAALFRRAAYYVDRILKGAKPADLPVEQPTKFELVINLKTAKALGLTIPPSLLFQADHVIQ
jgi:putative ABC transport system substrate-binding protein